ncbi:MAG: hypothetical protein ACXWH0_17140, partial [Acidimicrobiia bacterium]
QEERQAFERWMRHKWLARGEGAIPIAELKTWLSLMGMPQGSVRPPLIEMGEDQIDALRSDLDALGLLDSIPA